jgi:hypothetical protein
MRETTALDFVNVLPGACLERARDGLRPMI